MQHKVSVAACPDYGEATVKEALQKVLAPLGELPFIKQGAKIVIKANLVTMMKPDSAATTHPALLRELCEFLTAKGCDVVVGDSPGGLYNKAYVSAVYAATGVNAVTQVGARLNSNFEHVHAPNPSGLVLKEIDYTSYLDDADAIINFCKLKSHGMMGMSACVKNLFGAIPGTYKPEYHYKFPDHETFANMLIDINERFKPALCLVDAVIGMEGNGPTMGTPRKIGCILASDSPYACDEVCARLISYKPEELETVTEARKRGLTGEYEVVGDADNFIVPDFKLERNRKDLSFNRELPGAGGKLLGKIIRSALCSVPNVKKSECIGCEKCKNICPAKAITMKDKKPRIDRKKCIRCFCCQEFCPKGAMKVKRPIIAKIINR